MSWIYCGNVSQFYFWAYEDSKIKMQNDSDFVEINQIGPK